MFLTRIVLMLLLLFLYSCDKGNRMAEKRSSLVSQMSGISEEGYDSLFPQVQKIDYQLFRNGDFKRGKVIFNSEDIARQLVQEIEKCNQHGHSVTTNTYIIFYGNDKYLSKVYEILNKHGISGKSEITVSAKQ